MKIYTRTGDDGTTSLLGGKRISKTDIRVEAFGTVDELISWIGLLKDHKENIGRKAFLEYIQGQLMLCATTLATAPVIKEKVKYMPSTKCLTLLENEIDEIEKGLKPADTLILPGGNILVSYCHIARCVCRRAERAVLRLDQKEKTPDIIHKFLNRLSDYLFVLSRKISFELDIEEIKWQF